MGVTWHQHIELVVGAVDEDRNEALKALNKNWDFAKKPQAHVGRDLVVARAARMQLPAKRPDKLA